MKKIVFLFAVLSLVCSSCSVMCTKSPKLENTKWTAESRMFVADAGYETTTASLGFLPGKRFTLRFVSNLPAHPAMYVGPDGTVPTMPGHHSEWEKTGSYKISGDKCILTMDDGGSCELLIQGNPAEFSHGAGALLGNIFGYEEFLFHRD